MPIELAPWKQLGFLKDRMADWKVSYAPVWRQHPERVKFWIVGCHMCFESQNTIRQSQNTWLWDSRGGNESDFSHKDIVTHLFPDLVNLSATSLGGWILRMGLLLVGIKQWFHLIGIWNCHLAILSSLCHWTKRHLSVGWSDWFQSPANVVLLLQKGAKDCV